MGMEQQTFERYGCLTQNMYYRFIIFSSFLFKWENN